MTFSSMQNYLHLHVNTLLHSPFAEESPPNDWHILRFKLKSKTPYQLRSVSPILDDNKLTVPLTQWQWPIESWRGTPNPGGHNPPMRVDEVVWSVCVPAWVPRVPVPKRVYPPPVHISRIQPNRRVRWAKPLPQFHILIQGVWLCLNTLFNRLVKK